MSDHAEHGAGGGGILANKPLWIGIGAAGGGGILANKPLWIGIGAALFLLIGFVLPTPHTLVEIVEKYGFAEKLIAWGVAGDVVGAAKKAQIVLGIIPMAVIYFATEALPIG
ncbi:MAG: hypothetical protein JRI41_06460, partial [Deltaproteobacteria bacterium]|nr:hypothetical protein [Deltaproteobacteria bacterium]